MKVNRILYMVFALAAYALFPATPGAVQPTDDEYQVFVAPGLTDIQKATGCDFKPTSMGMEIINCPNQNGAFPQAGIEVGDTIFSIDGTPVTDILSLINAVQGAKGQVAQVIVRDHRTGQFAVLSVAL